jgi:hypothetical protein
VKWQIGLHTQQISSSKKSLQTLPPALGVPFVGCFTIANLVDFFPTLSLFLAICKAKKRCLLMSYDVSYGIWLCPTQIAILKGGAGKCFGLKFFEDRAEMD